MNKLLYFKHPIFLSKSLIHYLFSKVKSKPNGEVKINFDGQYIIGNPSHGSVNNRIWSYGFTEFLPTSLVKKKIKPNMVFLDVGANIGYFSFLAAKRVKDGGRVISFEPIPSVYKKLESGISANNYRCIESHRVALGNENKRIVMDIDDFQINDKQKDTNLLEVEEWKLDDYKKVKFERLDFIKMDIEGYELNALLGMKETIAQFKPFLMVEIHPDLLREREQTVNELFTRFQLQNKTSGYFKK